MSLSDKLKVAASEAQGSLCKLGYLLVGPKLSQEDKANLSTILNTSSDLPGSVSNSELGRILRDEGLGVSNSTIDRHRRGDCSCRESK